MRTRCKSLQIHGLLGLPILLAVALASTAF